MMSGPPIKDFREGWALPIRPHAKAHYYAVFSPGLAEAACGRSTAPANKLLGPGTYARCKICEALAEKLKEIGGARV